MDIPRIRLSFKKTFILDRTESEGGGGSGVGVGADKQAEGEEIRALGRSWASALLWEDELDGWGNRRRRSPGDFARARTGETNLLVTLDIFLVIGAAAAIFSLPMPTSSLFVVDDVMCSNTPVMIRLIQW